LKLGIVGSRTFDNYNLLEKEIFNQISLEAIECVISGGARGADTLAEKFADKYNIPKMIYKANWDKYGNIAGFLRNNDIVKNSDFIIAFWNGRSRGTQDTMTKAQASNKKLWIVRLD